MGKTSSFKARNRFSDIAKQNAVKYLMNTHPSVIVSVYVPRNIYDRWTFAHKLCEKMTVCYDLHQPYTEHINDSEYKQMKCFWLKNYRKIHNITDDELRDFQQIILNAIEQCDDIYFINLNSSAIDSVFLGEIFDVLIK